MEQKCPARTRRGRKHPPRWIILLALVGLAACTFDIEPPCPAGPDVIDPSRLEAQDEDLVAAMAIVSRYVPAADPQYRGYDIEIVERLAGLDESEQLMFVRTVAPTSNIDPGAEVFVFGTRGPRLAEISSSRGCPVLTPIDP